MKNESKGTAGAPMSSINLDVFHKKVTSKNTRLFATSWSACIGIEV